MSEMVADGRTRLKRFGIGMAAGCGGAWLAAVLIGPAPALAVAVLAFLASTFAADDGVGTFFPLALLFTLAVTLVLLMFIASVAVNL